MEEHPNWKEAREEREREEREREREEREREMEPGKGPPSKKKRMGGRDSEDEKEDLGAALPAALAGPAQFQQLAGGGGEVLDMPLNPYPNAGMPIVDMSLVYKTRGLMMGDGGSGGSTQQWPKELTCGICRQVSFGEMVGCDNTQCPIEWFHFACVGLQAKPKGKWFCPKCTEERKKKDH